MPEAAPKYAADFSRARAEPSPGPVRRWIIEHDDSWLFIVPYIGLAVVLSIVISLFWLVMVVAAHFVLEWVRQTNLARIAAERPGVGGLLLRVLWEIKLDLALVIFALVLAVYMEVVLGVVGPGAAGRAGTMATSRIGSRFAVLQRVLRGVLLSLDDAAQVVRVALQRRSASLPEKDVPNEDTARDTPGDESLPAPASRPSLRASWSRADYVVLGFGVLCLALLIVSPALTDHNVGSLLVTLGEELHPMPR